MAIYIAEENNFQSTDKMAIYVAERKEPSIPLKPTSSLGFRVRYEARLLR